MTDAHARVAALAAALAPARAGALLGRHLGVPVPEALARLAAPRRERLLRLVESLRPGTEDAPPWAPSGSGPGTLGREADGRRGPAAVKIQAGPPAWRVLPRSHVFPFELRPVSPALLELDGALLALGERAARAAAAGLASVLGGEASVRGRLLPGTAEPAASALVPLELTALAGHATLAVDCGFAARIAERVAGAAREVRAATSISPAARAVIELAVLGALDGMAAETDLEGALAPRLGLREGAPADPLCVELTVSAAGAEGKALLVLPRAALRALARTVELPACLAAAAVPGSLRSGATSLAPGEVGAFRPGDVLLLDAPPGGQASLRLPGGLTASGRLEGESLEVMEVDMEAGDLPVVVEVELACVPIPLRDVARIAPGAVLLLGLDRDGRVTLRVGDRAVAVGELVDVDGAVGVRILALDPRP